MRWNGFTENKSKFKISRWWPQGAALDIGKTKHNSKLANNKRFDKRISVKQNFLISSLFPDFGMSILYSVIARRTTVLARFASCIGNFSEITEVVLAKIWGSDSRLRGYDLYNLA